MRESSTTVHAERLELGANPERMDTGNDVLLTRIVLWSSILVAFGTPIVQWVAPANSLNISEALADGPAGKTVGLTEPADSFLLALWIALAAALLFTGTVTRLFNWRRGAAPLRRWETVLGFSSLFAFAGQVLFPLASGDQVRLGATPWWVVASFLIVTLGGVGNFVLTKTVWRRGLGFLTGILMTVALVQTPSSVVDRYHFSFAANEMLAVSAGEFPLGGVVHQYTNLLPYLVSPIVHVFPFNPISGVLLTTLFLQLLVLGSAGWIVNQTVRSHGVRAASYLIIAVFGISGYSYIQTFPIRYWLPMVVLLLIGNTCHSGKHARPSPALVGAILGVSSLLLTINNADFGGAAAVAIFAAEVAVMSRLEKRFRGWVLFVTGYLLGVLVALVLIGLLIGVLAGQFTPSDLLVFARAFGGAGLLKEPMALFEPAVVLVALGLAGLAWGLRIGNTGEKQLEVEEFWLVAMSLFLLLLLAYPMGRSFQQNFLAVSLPGVVIGAIILDRASRLQHCNQNSDWVFRLFSWFLGLVSLTFIAGQALSSVSVYGLSFWWQSSAELSIIEEDLFDRGLILESRSDGVELRLSATEDLPDAQILRWSNVYDLQFGLESVALSNDIASVVLVRELTDRQCLLISNFQGSILLPNWAVVPLGSSTVCAEQFTSRGVKELDGTELSVIGRVTSD